MEFNYVLKDGHTAETFWASNQRIVYQPQSGGSGNIIADLTISVVQAAGPYRKKEHKLDAEQF